ncbi:MAG: ABC transporter ATP-binding protein [Jatrophihabitans sp.]
MTGLEVQCVQLRHEYVMDGETVVALDGIDLTIAAGVTTAVVGPSGSGKSTLLTILAGLQRPTAGEALIGGVDIAAMRQGALLRERAERIGVLAQGPGRNLLPYLDAAGNIRFAQCGARSYRRRELPDADDLLRELGLDALGGTRVDRLSGGERQRLAVATAVSGAPGVLLADEPTSQLDLANRDRVVELLERVNQSFGTTVVAVTHDPEIAGRFGQSVRIESGRLVRGGWG